MMEERICYIIFTKIDVIETVRTLDVEKAYDDCNIHLG